MAYSAEPGRIVLDDSQTRLFPGEFLARAN